MFVSVSIEGTIEDMGILPGWIKLDGEAGTPNALLVPGVEKSSISLLNKMPVFVPRTLEPKLKMIKSISIVIVVKLIILFLS